MQRLFLMLIMAFALFCPKGYAQDSDTPALATLPGPLTDTSDTIQQRVPLQTSMALNSARLKLPDLAQDTTLNEHDAMLLKMFNERIASQKAPYGWLVGLLLITIIVVFTAIVLSRFTAAMSAGKFDLKDALSENIQIKTIVKNPLYEQLPAIIQSFNDAAGRDKANSGGSADDKAKLADATTARLAAEQTLATAQTAVDGAASEKAAKEAAIADLEAKLESAKRAETDAADDGKETAAQARADAETALKEAVAALAALPDTAASMTAATSDLAMNKADEARMLSLMNNVTAATLSSAILVNLGNLFPQTIEVTADVSGKADQAPLYRPSASRLIAFISAILLFIVGLSSSCFFLYFYMVNGVAPDLGKLSAILIALGIGMAPYAVSKVANAATDKDKII